MPQILFTVFQNLDQIRIDQLGFSNALPCFTQMSLSMEETLDWIKRTFVKDDKNWYKLRLARSDESLLGFQTLGRREAQQNFFDSLLEYANFKYQFVDQTPYEEVGSPEQRFRQYHLLTIQGQVPEFMLFCLDENTITNFYTELVIRDAHIVCCVTNDLGNSFDGSTSTVRVQLNVHDATESCYLRLPVEVCEKAEQRLKNYAIAAAAAKASEQVPTEPKVQKK